MKQNNFGLLSGEISVDNFAGGGGASTGYEMATGKSVDIAINHDPDAIDMHRLNHPDTKHYCEDVWHVDPIEACAGRPVGVAWFSPDCKHFSKAKGSAPVDKNIRGLAWVAIRWPLLVPVRTLYLENVEEFKTWGPVIYNDKGKPIPCPERKGETFDGFIKALTTGLKPDHPAWVEAVEALQIEDKPELQQRLQTGLGYDLEHRILHACDYGAATIRKRFFLVARNDGLKIGWPEITHGKVGSGLKPFVTAAEVIDWSKPCRSIFGRKKPLAEKTMARIAKGLEKFVFNSVNPFVVPEECVVPFITEHANGSSQRNMPITEPLRTICAQVKGGHFALVNAYIAKHYTGVDGSDIKTPLHTITTQDHNALVTSHMIKFRDTNVGHETRESLHTISAGDNHLGEVRAFFIQYYGESVGHEINRPLGTITTKDRFALITIRGEQYQIVDIGMRMLEPEELFAAQSFPEDYQIAYDMNGKKISKARQVSRCGNSVPPLVAKELILANLSDQPMKEAA